MKKRIGRLSAIVLSVVLTAGLLAGCGGAKEEAPAAGSSEAPAAASSAPQSGADLNEVTLKIYFAGESKSEAANVWEAVGEICKDKLNAKFEANWIPFADYGDKLIVLSAAGDKYDMNFDGDWLAYPKMVNKGAYLNIKDLLPQYAPKTYESLKSSGALQAGMVKGELLCIPWEINMNQDRMFITYRADLADKAGIKMDSIQTVEDLDAALTSAKKALPNVQIMKWNVVDMPPYEELFLRRDELHSINFHNFVIDLNDPTYKIIPLEQTQAFKDSAKMSKKWYDDGIIAKNMMVDIEEQTPAFAQGKTFAQITSHEWAFNNPSFTDSSFKAASSGLYPDKKTVNRSALANVMAINGNAANPERALMFLELMSTDKAVYDTVMYGIEGKTYKLDGDKAVTVDGQDAANSNYLDWRGQWGLWKPQFMRPTDTYPAGFWEEEAEFAKQPGNSPNPLDGLFFDTTNIKNEIARRDQINTELARILMFGAAKDVDKAVDELIEKQKAAGLDKVQAELQKQLDEFLKSKQ